MSNSRFQVKVNQLSNMVIDHKYDRCLGGFGSSFYRSWVFPLYTPYGLTVIQEYAYDHPFHNGFFVGQHPVLVGGREANFWMAPPPRSFTDPNYRNLGRVDAPKNPRIDIGDDGVRFTVESVWRDENEEPILNEVREVYFYSHEDATVCEMTSRKIAAYGAVDYPRTKFGSIGLRIEPRLLPTLGGQVIADQNRRGDADVVSETESDFVAYENKLGGSTAGVFIAPLDSEERGPWFVRDYGMAMYNPTWNKSIHTPEGGEWSIALRVAAYDGPITEERIQRWVTK